MWGLSWEKNEGIKADSAGARLREATGKEPTDTSGNTNRGNSFPEEYKLPERRLEDELGIWRASKHRRPGAALGGPVPGADTGQIGGDTEQDRPQGGVCSRGSALTEGRVQGRPRGQSPARAGPAPPRKGGQKRP